jgi:EAL domain-containing protein (putative c-di-GMP-specific phosphodiesterase class I)
MHGSDVHFFSPEMKTTSEAKQQFEHDMRRAISHNELFLLYQPKISLRSGRISGFEALLRWNSPEQGVLLPAAFLPEAEENGMIVQFGDVVLRHSCAFLQRLAAAGHGNLTVSVNVSQREFCSPHYARQVGDMLARYRLPPSSLDVEMREADLVRNHHRGATVLAELAELGVLRSVDAFGDGMAGRWPRA